MKVNGVKILPGPALPAHNGRSFGQLVDESIVIEENGYYKILINNEIKDRSGKNLNSLVMTSHVLTMRSFKRSSIALAVLAMLYEEPMHPYRMQRLIKERGKDLVINVERRSTLYQTVQRLEREGLIRARQTLQDKGRPERTVYEIAADGRATLMGWMREILSTPTVEFPDFPAAVSFLALLSPEDARLQFEIRAAALEKQISAHDESMRGLVETVPRLFLLESEYMRAAQVTELNWVRSVIEDFRSGGLTWSESWLREIAAQFATDPTKGGE